MNPAAGQPIDYKELWGALITELRSMKLDKAQRCATEKDLDRVRHHQGAFACVDELMGTMERILIAARETNRGE